MGPFFRQMNTESLFQQRITCAYVVVGQIITIEKVQFEVSPKVTRSTVWHSLKEYGVLVRTAILCFKFVVIIFTLKLEMYDWNIKYS